ncbi:hypothetical protein A4X03_0g7430 [Tilletia caries]|uniref:Uncharacterized protein n=1 Tax=Tilletia caries TaxID=13290 RepID=A0A8T8SRU2_9BASI|nr:hypothetical protein A4X03_0g7430 [Tilletia caries]
MVPGMIGNTSLERARHEWYEWHSKYNGMPDLTRDMVVDAQNIFHASIHGSYYLCISLTIWGVMCIILSGAYTVAACSLIRDLRQHLKVRRGDPPPQKFRGVIQKRYAHDQSTDRPIQQLSEAASNCTLASSGTLESALSRRCDSRGSEEHQEYIQSRMFTVRERTEDRSGAFFPPVAPSRTVVHLPTSKAEQVLFYFTGSVILACLSLLGVTLFMVIHSFAAAESNRYESVEMTSYIGVAIITMLAGTASFLSVAHSTFEASISTLVYSRRANQGTPENFLDMT